MITILALILSILLLLKVITFLIFPDQFLEFTERTYAMFENYGLVIQGILIAATIIVGIGLSYLIGFYELIVAGFFWSLIYSLFLVPFTIDLAKKDALKTTLLSADLKNQILAACVFVICFCILAIALVL